MGYTSVIWSVCGAVIVSHLTLYGTSPLYDSVVKPLLTSVSSDDLALYDDKIYHPLRDHFINKNLLASLGGYCSIGLVATLM